MSLYQGDLSDEEAKELLEPAGSKPPAKAKKPPVPLFAATEQKPLAMTATHKVTSTAQDNADESNL